MSWSSYSLRRVVIIPGRGLLDPCSGRQFSPLQQEPFTHLCSVTFQQIWIIHFDRMQRTGTENLNVREQLAVQHSACILSCSVCWHLDRPVWVAHVLSYLLHLAFRQPNVRSEGCLRIHLSMKLSLVLHTPAPKSTWISRLVVLQYYTVLSSTEFLLPKHLYLQTDSFLLSYFVRELYMSLLITYNLHAGSMWRCRFFIVKSGELTIVFNYSRSLFL